MKMLRIILLALVAINLSACALFNSSSAPKMAALTSFKPTLAVRSDWSRSVGGIGKYYVKLTPATAGNQIYTASYSGYLTATDLNSGRKLWQINTKMPLTSGVEAADGMVFVGTGKGQVLAYSQANGSLVWWAALSNEVLAAPTAIGNQLLVKSVDDHVYVFNINNGKQNWTYAEPAPELIIRGGSSVVAANGSALIGFADGQLGVFTLTSGQPIWKQPIAQANGASVIDQMVDITSNTVVVGNVAYVATYQGVVAAVSLPTGRIIWKHEVSDYAGLAVDASNVYVTDADSKVWAFNRQTGQVAWENNQLFARRLTGPAVMGNAVVVGDSQGYLHWLAATDGHFVARAHADSSGIIATPVVLGNNVYIYTNSGELVKYSVLNGN